MLLQVVWFFDVCITKEKIAVEFTISSFQKSIILCLKTNKMMHACKIYALIILIYYCTNIFK